MFSRHLLERQADGSYVLFVYLNENQMEAADDFAATEPERKQTIFRALEQYVSRNIPKSTKLIAAHVMFGSVLLGTVSFHPQPASAAGSTFNLGYQYLGSSSEMIKQLDRAKNTLSAASPSFLQLTTDGNLKLSPQYSPSYVQEAHNRGLKVVPHLSNDWDRNIGRAALQNRDPLVAQISDAVARCGFDGVNVDLENLTETDRDAHTDFVKALRQALPDGKEVSVAVAANPNNWSSGWHGSYDNKALAESADYLMLMAYDETWQGSVLPGPVASYGFTERSIRALLNQGVPASKIVLGLPFYGRYWVQGEPLGGYAITDAQIQKMLQTYESTETYDATTQSVQAVVRIKPGDPTMKVSGRVLGEGTYTIWYENADSVKAKLGLVSKYSLRGTGEWSLGQENPDIWEAFAGQTTPGLQEQIRSIRTDMTGIGVILDGKEVQFDQKPFTKNDRTLVPFRAIFEQLGAEVTWEGETQTVRASKEGTQITLRIGSKTATVNGKTVTLDVAPIETHGRTFVPIRFVSEALGATVDWDEETQTVLIDTKQGVQQ